MTAFPLHPVAVRGIKATEYRHTKKSSLMNVLVKVLNMPAKSTAVPCRKDEKAADPLSIKMSVESPMHPRFLQQLQKGGDGDKKLTLRVSAAHQPGQWAF